VTALEGLLASREMILVAGSGGVGKTTVAAALGIAAVQRHSARVLVVTVDPARRLASALGLEVFGNEPVAIDPAGFADAGVSIRGELHAAMLDTKAGWDSLIRRHAPDADVREAVLDNPLYQNITGRFVHSHDYLAMEQLHDLHASGEYDLVIVDTPPSRSAISILDAPSRMVEFFGSRLLRWLTVPYRSRLFSMASRPFQQVADRILGSHFLQDIADFFVLFQAMEEGFVRRAREVESLLVDPRTAFVIVTTLETAPSHEAEYLANALAARGMPLGAIVANRVLPVETASVAASESANRLVDSADGDLAERVAARLSQSVVGAPGGADAAPPTVDAQTVGQVLSALGRGFDDIALVAARERERRAELELLCPTLVSVPWMAGDIHDLAGLAELAGHLHGPSDAADSRR
jgi:anion-transporting  ArsA/GET3 family ATPase